MEALAIAFACVWVGVALYVGRLHAQQRKLTRQLDGLTQQLAASQPAKSSSARAA